MSNFDFLLAEKSFASFASKAVNAEKTLNISAPISAISTRIALEAAVKWIYANDGELNTPTDTTLSSLISNKDFQQLIDEKLINILYFIKKIGNNAAHNDSDITRGDAVLALRGLFEFFKWLAYCYADSYKEQNFNDDLLPIEGESHSKAELQKLRDEILGKDEKIDEMQQQLDEMRKQLEKSRKTHQKQRNYKVDELTEAETRKRYIDFDLERVGWYKDKNYSVEVPVKGMPNTSGNGYCDYVLYGKDQKPLAIVEAKKTKYSAEKGAHQAKLYAECLEKQYGVKPLIFLTNGFEIYFIDTLNGYPRRKVAGFFTQEELQMRMNRRLNSQKLLNVENNSEIAGRTYQIAASRAFIEAAANKRRKMLIVQATGTGKTRVAISIVDMLFRADWAKNVLFLADRTALVKQAKNAFQEFFSKSVPLCNLTENKDDPETSRIIFSTYPTMMNAIDKKKADGQPLFTPAHFDLIIIDESHRSIYQHYKDIFDYFDSMLLGLTATPKAEVDRNTYRIFELEEGVPTFNYDYETAVKEECLVNYEGIICGTEILQRGIKYSELSDEDKAEYEEKFGEVTDDNAKDIDPAAFNTYIFNAPTIQLMLSRLMTDGLKIEDDDKLGKTIIFAKNRRHAEAIVKEFRKMYPELGDDFIQQVDCTMDYVDNIIDKFKTADKFPQIAVSVDMLDTGIDVPEILNLVFFKIVRSYSKFWQMIGRGTRLCKNLFGEGSDKEKFLIFDYGGNFDFFSVQENNKKEGQLVPSMTSRIFTLKCWLVLFLSEHSELKNLYDELIEQLHRTVTGLDDSSFRVSMHREIIEKYRCKDNWYKLKKTDVQKIEAELAAVISGESENLQTRRFDHLLYSMMLDFLSNRDFNSKIANVQQSASALSKSDLKSIPQVQEKREFISELTQPKFWEQINIELLEKIRRELREVVQFINTPPQEYYNTNFDDIEITPHHPFRPPIQTDMRKYKDKVQSYLKEHMDNPAVYKLRHNQKITPEELAELERILWNDLGSQEDYKSEYGDMPVGKLVRKIVGMDRQALENAFNEFLQNNRLNSNQIDFVRQIIEYIAINGFLEDRNILGKSPFIQNGGIAYLFKNNTFEIPLIMKCIDDITNNATLVA